MVDLKQIETALNCAEEYIENVQRNGPDDGTLALVRTAKRSIKLKHEVHLMLALSTSHVSNETRLLLDSDGFHFLECVVITYSKDTDGWFLPVLDHTHDEPEPEDLKAIFAFARTHGYTWLMFDCDAPEVEELPLSPW